MSQGDWMSSLHASLAVQVADTCEPRLERRLTCKYTTIELQLGISRRESRGSHSEPTSTGRTTRRRCGPGRSRSAGRLLRKGAGAASDSRNQTTNPKPSARRPRVGPIRERACTVRSRKGLHDAWLHRHWCLNR